MRKIFTLAVAVLASFSLMADDFVLSFDNSAADKKSWTTTDGSTFTIDPAHGGNAWAVAGVTFFKFSANKTYTITIPSDIVLEKVHVAGYTNGSSTAYFSKIAGQDVSDKKFPAKASGASSQTFNEFDVPLSQTGGTVAFEVPSGDQIALFLTFSGTLPIPTDPVSTVDISGSSSTYVNQKITLEATTDQRAESYKWAVNGTDQAGATSRSFDFTPTTAGTYNIVAYAKNSINGESWVASAAHVVTVSGPKEQVDITGTTVWDWAKASSESEIKLTDSSSPKKNDTIVLANISKMNNNSEFNSQALVFVGDYVVRTVNSTVKRCQGSLLRFNTTVSGYVSVEYSNTGNRTEEAERRFLTVNGTQVTGDPGSMKNDVSLVIYNVPVAAGTVSLSGVIPGSSEPTKPQPLSFYKVTFSTEQISTALDNTAEEVKAVKTFENGQLVIIKNGVKYNATGAIVK